LNSQVTWEIKDRTYILARGMSPLTYTIPSKHTNKHALLFFDEELQVFKKKLDTQQTKRHPYLLKIKKEKQL
jgi:hypothetical protein